jgi:hypothetical protein
MSAGGHLVKPGHDELILLGSRNDAREVRHCSDSPAVFTTRTSFS